MRYESPVIKIKSNNVTGHPDCCDTQHTFEIQNLDVLWLCQLLTVCVVFPPSAIHFACFVNAEEELVGRVKSPKSDVTLKVIVTASVPFQRP